MKIKTGSKNSEKTLLWTCVDHKVREIVERLVNSKGVTISEYVRSLVLEDLDKRNVFTAQLKEAPQNG